MKKKRAFIDIKRYEMINMGNQWEPCHEMQEHECGSWVKYEDIEELLYSVAELNQLVDEIIKRGRE